MRSKFGKKSQRNPSAIPAQSQRNPAQSSAISAQFRIKHIFSIPNYDFTDLPINFEPFLKFFFSIFFFSIFFFQNLFFDFFFPNFYHCFRILEAPLKQNFLFFFAQSDTFYPILSTFFLNIHVPGYMKIWKKFQRNLGQSWTKRVQIVIFLISITVLGYYKAPIKQDCAQNLKKISAQSSAILDKKASNSNFLNFYHHFRIL